MRLAIFRERKIMTLFLHYVIVLLF
jgi:hypothetical protein